MVQAMAARGVRPDWERAPERDGRTSRGSRWMHFPVTFPDPTAVPADAATAGAGA